MSLFKKRVAKNLRQKRAESDEEIVENQKNTTNNNNNSDESSRDSTPVSVSGENSRSSTTNATKTPSTLLSFGGEDDDESEYFRVKKSSQSRKFEKMRQRMRAENERQKSKITDKTDETESSEISSSNSFTTKTQRRKKADSPLILTGKDAEAIDLADEDQEFRRALTSGAIPDAKLIHMARKQRQQARETADVIPLDDTQKYKREKSRFVREDENEGSDSGEEGGQFYSKFRNENDDERRKVESEFLNTEQGSDNENDDEFDRWEQEQIRKGVSIQQLSLYQQEQIAASGYYYQQAMYPGYQQAQYYSHTSHVINLESPPTVEIKDPQPMDLDIDLPLPSDDSSDHIITSGVAKGCAPLPKIGGGDMESVSSAKKLLNLGSIRSKIKEKYDEYVAVVRALSLDQEKLSGQITENEHIIERLEESTPKLSKQYEFYQEIRAYIRDLLDCFDEKMTVIEELEQRALTIFQNRSTFVMRRRKTDVEDQYNECAMANLGKNQRASSPNRMMRIAEREARRTRRRQAREKSLAGLGHHDGMSSDDEEAPSRIANFVNEIEKIESETATVFDDAIDDYSSVQNVIDRFLVWRKQDYDAYEQAFVDLCLPKLLSPLIRLQMITWNPIDADCLSLDKFSWYLSLKSAISEYNIQYQTGLAKQNDVGFLISSVIEKVVCPKLTDLINKVWDPLSASQSERLASFVGHLIKEYFSTNAEESKNLQAALDAVAKRIKSLLDTDLFTPFFSKEQLENRSTGASIYLDRQFWSSLKFMKNVLFWENILPASIVQELALDGVLNRHLVLSLQFSIATESSTLLKCKSICNTFPSSWLKKNQSPQTQLEPLMKIFVRIAEEISKSKSQDKNDAHDRIKELCRLLLKLGDTKYSATMIEKYRLRI